MRRPVILWICAALLGLAAGLRWAQVLGSPSDADFAPKVKGMGFESVADFRELADLVNAKRVTSLDDRQVALVEKYADRATTPHAFVCAVLGNIWDDHLAARLVRVASKARATDPSDPMIQTLEARWERQGCARAAKQLRQSSDGRP